MPKAAPRRSLSVGVVGPHDLVERIAEVGSALTQGPWRLRLDCLGYDEEHEVATKLPGQFDDADSLLFTGPLPYDIAEQAGLLHVPTVQLPLSGAALYSTLLRAVLERDVDIRKVSIDSLSRDDVLAAYSDLDISGNSVRVMPYSDPAAAQGFFDFHRKLHARGSTKLALTTVRSVAERLEEADVPVLRMTPTSSTIKEGLKQVVLMGMGSQLEGGQAAICIVEVMPPSRSSRVESPYWQEDLRLAAHRILLHEARPMGAMIIQRDQSSYTVLTTLGPLADFTRDFATVPFAQRLEKELGVDARVGIGLGHTLQAADQHAQEALAAAATDASSPPSVTGPYGPSRLFPTRAATTTAETADRRARDLFKQLLSALGTDSAGASVVLDAERVAALLDVTPRTARRALQTMGDLGLVWSVPPHRSQGRGRPRQRYRLVSPETSDGD